MDACQGELRLAVIKLILRVSRRMASQTGGAIVGVTVHAMVFIIGLGIGMARCTRKFGKIHRIGVAILAGIPLAFVFTTVYRKVFPIMRQILCGHPVRIGGMALDTVLRKAQHLVVGIYRGFVIIFMTGYAFRRGIGECSTGMAFGTIGYVVSLGKRKEVVIDPLGGPVKSRNIVAILAARGKANLLVIGTCRGQVVRTMAIDAFVAKTIKAQRGFRGVALGTGSQGMSAEQRKTIVLMKFQYVVYQPVGRIVASGTIGADGAVVHVGVAGITIHFRFGEDQAFVAGTAIHINVLAGERKIRFGVAETCSIPANLPTRSSGKYRPRPVPGVKGDAPAVGCVAVGAVDPEIGAMRGLSIQPPGQESEENDYKWQSIHSKLFILY